MILKGGARRFHCETYTHGITLNYTFSVKYNDNDSGDLLNLSLFALFFHKMKLTFVHYINKGVAKFKQDSDNKSC